MQDAHTLYMDLSNLVFVQRTFIFLQVDIFTHIFFLMPMGYIHGG
jgi:hypothetical protein